MKVYSVSEFVQSLNALIEATLPSVAISGEISGYREAQHRMVYFDLKDEKSKILCFALKREVARGLADGMSVTILGSPRLFVGSGQFHVRVKEIECMGEGTLRKLYNELLSRLEKEGLFSEERKKPLPRYPETIGLITSQDAAAYADVIKILKEKKVACRVLLYPVNVQGLGSESSVVAGLEYFNKHQPVDVLMLVRGGGSMEDLQTFNSEKVARSIASSRIPVIVGVGHERDVTIADMVADRRASTPTNAAEIVLPSKGETLERIASVCRGAGERVGAAMVEHRRELTHLAHTLELASVRAFESVGLLIRGVEKASAAMTYRCLRHRQNIERTRSSLLNIVTRFIQASSHRVELFLSSSALFDPREVLKKGYTLTLKNQRIVKSRNHVSQGDAIETKFADGCVISVVK